MSPRPARVRWLALAIGAAAWAWWRPFRVEVRGSSMSPSLHEGDWLVAVRTRRVRLGDVVVFESARRPGLEMVKRVAAVAGQSIDGVRLGAGEVWVLGDNAAGTTDSRAFGSVDAGDVKGVVVARYRPAFRAGRVARGPRATRG